MVESQGKVDERKRGSWPYYLSYLYEKYRCEPVLIVITQSSRTAQWASRPIRLGFRDWHSLTVRPLVLGPDNVPVIADERQAEKDVPLAVLSAMTHGRGPQAAAKLQSLAAALRTIDARPEPLPELQALRGLALKGAELLEWTGKDVAQGNVDVRFAFETGRVTIFNALDENGLSFDPAPSRPAG